MGKYNEKLQSMEKDVVNDILKVVIKGKVDISVLTSDPYNPENDPVNLIEVRKEGIQSREYDEIIDFGVLSIETLITVLEEVKKEKVWDEAIKRSLIKKEVR